MFFRPESFSVRVPSVRGQTFQARRLIAGGFFFRLNSYMLLAARSYGVGSMPRKGITGHDEWVVTEALATALIALEQLPPQRQPRTHMDDIRKLLAAGCGPETVALHLAQAKCRLFPDLDPPTIYREYGIGGDGRE